MTGAEVHGPGLPDTHTVEPMEYGNRVLYRVRITAHPPGGVSHVRCTQVWDGDRCLFEVPAHVPIVDVAALRYLVGLVEAVHWHALQRAQGGIWNG